MMPNKRIREQQRNNPVPQYERYWNARPVKQTSRDYPQNRESARRKRQIERGSLKAENGLVV